MTNLLAVLSIILGTVYTSYGLLTVADLIGGWRRFGFSHFGLAWIAMAFTCGPHHLEHGLHVLSSGRPAGSLELISVIAGFPAGVIWFLLRVEATVGGRGDRVVAAEAAIVRLLPYLFSLYLMGFAVFAATILVEPAQFPPIVAANLMLVVLYGMIGWYLLRSQLANQSAIGHWSLSGLALTLVFPTCALMHAAWVVHQVVGDYEADIHTRIIDWVAVPAAAYFLWVVRGLHAGTVRDWNEATTGVVAEPVMEPSALR